MHDTSSLSRKSQAILVALLILTLGSLSPPQVAGQTPAEPASDSEPEVVDEASSLLAEIEQYQAEYAELDARTSESVGDEGVGDEGIAIAEMQAQQRIVDWLAAVDRLVGLLRERMEEGQETADLQRRTRKVLRRVEQRIPAFVNKVMAKNAELRSEISEVAPENQTTAEARLRGNEEVLDEIVRFYLSLVDGLDLMKLGSKRARAGAAEKLELRAGNLSARLQLANEKLEDALAMPSDVSASDREAAVRAAQDTFDQIAASLWTTCDVMDELGLPTAEHRQMLILETGELTTEILDTEVMTGLVEESFESFRRWLEHGGPAFVGRAFGFLIILVISWLLAAIVRRLVPRLVARSGEQLSELAGRIIVNTASQVTLGIGLLVALSQVGVNVTALLAGLGIVGFIIGFALQDTLGNFAAGAMILIYQPFDVGDVIEAGGVLGTVDHMTLVSTRILTFDNQTMIVPNTRIWGNVIRNATDQKLRRVDLSFPLAVDVDARAAEAVFDAMCREHPAVLEDPAPAIKVQEVKSTGVLYVVRPWVKTSDYWQTYWDLNREAQIRLREAGIQIAMPYGELGAALADDD